MSEMILMVFHEQKSRYWKLLISLQFWSRYTVSSQQVNLVTSENIQVFLFESNNLNNLSILKQTDSTENNITQYNIEVFWE